MGVRPEPKIERNKEIARRLSDGESYKKLMEEFNLSKTRVYDIRRQVEKGYGSKKNNSEN